jgi:GNAT superfamily N-acetyltransferase
LSFSVKRSPAPIALNTRLAYLDLLAEPQELYVEQMVANGIPWLIADGGYAVTSGESLIELYLPDASDDKLTGVAKLLRHEAGVQQILYKSFDPQLNRLADLQNSGCTVVGHLFRQFSNREVRTEELTPILRPSAIEDLQKIAAIDDSFFSGPNEIQEYHRNGGLYSLVTPDQVLLGCGITTRVIPDHRILDLGMLVAPEHRNQNLGAFIINQLALRCITDGDRPICGCSSDNKASFRALNKAGFTSNYQNLRIELDQV